MQLQSSIYYMGTSLLYPDHDSEERFHQVLFRDNAKRFFTSITCGRQSIFFIDDQKQLWGMGSSNYGQLGFVTDTIQYNPVCISQEINHFFDHVACGDNHVLALTSHYQLSTESYQLYIWGLNNMGQLGIEASKKWQQPMEVSKRINLKVAAQVNRMLPPTEESETKKKRGQYAYQQAACSSQHTFLIVEGALFAFGKEIKNRLGLLSIQQIRDGLYLAKKEPIMPIQHVPISEHVMGVCASNYHAMAWTLKGALFTWGDASDGKLGRGFGSQGWVSIEEVGVVSELSHEHIISAACGYSYSVALTQNGQLYGWGKISKRLPEDQTPCVIDVLQPRQLLPAGGTKFVKVVGGYTHFAALTILGAMFTWGDNIEQCLGPIGEKVLMVPTLVKFKKEYKIIDIDTGQNFTAFIGQNGKGFYESPHQRRLKSTSLNRLKQDIQVIRDYSKVKMQIEERRSSMLHNIPVFTKPIKAKKPGREKHHDGISDMGSHKVLPPPTRPSTQQLSAELWNLLQPGNSVAQSRLLSPAENQRNKAFLKPNHLQYMKKYHDGMPEKGKIHLSLDEAANRILEKQAQDPIHLQIRQDSVKRDEKTDTKYHMDSPDFYTSPVAKDFDPVKKDLLKCQYIDMIKAGHEQRHWLYIFGDKPNEWKPDERISEKIKMRLTKGIPESVIRNANKPIRNSVTRQDEQKMLQSVRTCIEKAKDALSPKKVRRNYIFQ